MSVIGHRGASGYRPEHTLESYRLAAEMGADFIEPDLVSTKDGVLVARHENEISQTTDVADHPEFADRRGTRMIDGGPVTGWFTEDFTLAELQTLRARERIPHLRPANVEYDGRFAIPTFDEVLALAAELGVAVYPETKHPSYFRRIGLPLEEPLVGALRDTTVPAWVQSFETDSLRRVAAELDVPLVRLLPRMRITADFLAETAEYAAAIGPLKHHVIPLAADQTLGRPSGLVEQAHAAGLHVHAWTFRAENEFLPAEFRSSDDPAALGDLRGELEVYLAAGVDGVFTDHPDVARGCWKPVPPDVRDWLARQRRRRVFAGPPRTSQTGALVVRG